MTRKKLKMSLVIFSILYWMLAAFYFVTLRYAGMGRYAPPDLLHSELVTYSAVVGFFIGLLFSLFPLSSFPLFKKRKSFLSVLAISTTFYILFFLAVIFLSSLYGNSIQFALFYVFSPDGLTVLFHLSLASLLYHFILQINRRFGPGVLLEYTFGKYFSPKEEVRAFLFLDLQSSTHLAETLEHVSYSRMIQDCYAELTGPLLDYNARVYQYVGDEVVVSWKMDRFFSASFCYDFYYDFCDRVEAKKEYFMTSYGVHPKFKAGLHCGKVIVAQVGEIKTEIAYHGDVLNTAARIQGLCNYFEQSFLLSESFLHFIPKNDRMRVKFVTETQLRGKATSTKIFMITGTNAHSEESSPFQYNKTELQPISALTAMHSTLCGPCAIATPK